MPPRRKKQRLTPSPSPIPSIHSSPEPESLPQASEPIKPCSEALLTLDIVHQICLHLPRRDLKACFYLSNTFYQAAGRILYSHIDLSKVDTVLKIISHAAPARTTRRHVKKKLTPLAFLRYTTAITIGDELHRQSDLPPDWKEILVSLLPNVRNIHIQPMLRCRVCKSNRSECLKDMWRLANSLNACEVSISSRCAEGSSWNGRNYRTLSPLALPDMSSSTIKTLTILRSWSDESLRILHMIKTDSGASLMSCFETIRTAAYLRNPERQYLNHKTLDQLSGMPAGRNFLRSDWKSIVPTLNSLAEQITLMISDSTSQWVLYQLQDIYPQESSIWPLSIKDDLSNSNDTSLAEIVVRSIKAKYPNRVKQPDIIFRSRADFLGEWDQHLQAKFGDFYYELSAETTDFNGSGLLGTWELVNKRPLIDKDSLSLDRRAEVNPQVSDNTDNREEMGNQCIESA